MDKKIFANRFGLAIAFVFLSLLPSNAAWAQKTQGTQQVVVTNSAAQPVPMSGLVYVQNSAAQPVPVAISGSEYFQVSAVGNTLASVVLPIPEGKTLIVEHINISLSGANADQTFAAHAVGSSGYGNAYAWLSITKGFQDDLYGTFNWGGDTQVMMAADQQLTVSVEQRSGTFETKTYSVLVSGHLIPTSF